MSILSFFLTFFKSLFIGIVTLDFFAYFTAAFAALSLFGIVFNLLIKGEY